DEASLDSSTARSISRRIGGYLTVISVVVAISGVILIPPIFGNAFGSARWALLLLAPGLIPRGVFHAGISMLLARGRGRDAARMQAMVLTLAVPLWVASTEAFGINGAAAASTVIYAVQALLIVRAFN